MDVKRSLILACFIVLSYIPQIGPAAAETILNDQIIKSDMTLTKDQSPYQVKGVLQIPEGVTLRIDPGVGITFKAGSAIKNFGNVVIGDNKSSEKVFLTEDRFPNNNRENESLINGVARSSVSISNTELVSKNRDSLVFGCLSLSISNSSIIGFNRIVYQQECQNFTLQNSYTLNLRYLYTCAFDGHPDTFIVKDNIFEGALDFCEVPDRTFHTSSFFNKPNAQTIYEVMGNDFEALSQINLPVGYTQYQFSGNNLRKVEKVKLFSFTIPGKPVITNLAGNYWKSASNESSLKSVVKVIDSNTDMTLKDAISLSPLLTQPVQLNSIALGLRTQYQESIKAKAGATGKKSTITCVKGKLAKKVTAVNPKCPSGYTVKK
jgi:hypothetical protein